MAPTTKPYVPPGKGKRDGLSTGALVGIVVGAVVLLFAVIAVVANLGGGDDTASGAGGKATETSDVTWTGTQLPPEPQTSGEPDAAIGLVPAMLTGTSIDGTPLTIDPTDGRAKMLVFVAHWCQHCQAEIPRIVQWNAAGQKPAELDVYAIATGTDKAAPNYPPSSWLAREGWPFPALADGPGPRPNFEAATAYGLTSYPYNVVVGADGKVKGRHSGEFGSDDATAIAAMDAFVRTALAS